MMDDDKLSDEFLKRALRVACVVGFFVLTLLGFYAEIALTTVVCGLLQLHPLASCYVHFVAFGAYVAAVVFAGMAASGAEI